MQSCHSALPCFIFMTCCHNFLISPNRNVRVKFLKKRYLDNFSSSSSSFTCVLMSYISKMILIGPGKPGLRVTNPPRIATSTNHQRELPSSLSSTFKLFSSLYRYSSIMDSLHTKLESSWPFTSFFLSTSVSTFSLSMCIMLLIMTSSQLGSIATCQSKSI